MKIGPLDIGVKSLALAAAVVVVAMVDLKLALSDNTRVEGYYRARIPEYLMAEMPRDYEDGVKQCDNLLTVRDRSVSARLYKATFLYRLKSYPQAKEVFQLVADDTAAASQQRAMALCGIGAVAFLNRAEAKRAAAAAESCEWYLKALKLDPELSDAKVGILAAAMWRLSTVEEGSDTPEAKAVYKQVGAWLSLLLKEAAAEQLTAVAVNAQLVKVVGLLEKGRPASFESMALFYQLKGQILGRVEQTVGSDAAFGAAQAVRLRWDLALTNQWRTMLKLLPRAKMKPEEREALLNKYRSKANGFPKDSQLAFNALGVSWYRLMKTTSDPNLQSQSFTNAIETLRPGYDAGDPAAMTNALALLDEQLYENVITLIPPGYFFPLPEQSGGNPWFGEETSSKVQISPEMRRTLGLARQLACSMRSLLAAFIKSGRVDAKRDVDFKLRMLACDTIAAHADYADSGRWAALSNQATELAAQAADVPEVLRAHAYYMLLSGKYPEAGKALRRAAELDPNNAKMTDLVRVVSSEPRLVHPRPAKTGWFGDRALLRATLLSSQAPGGISSGEMLYDGQKVGAQIVGSQMLFIVPETRMGDGNHKVKATAFDGYGNKAEIEFEFDVDKVPPTAASEPAPGSDVGGPLPVWTIKLSDVGVGVDLLSVQIRLKNVAASASATPCRLLLVDNGIYQVDIAGVSVKRGDILTSGDFKVGSVTDLTAGQYELSVSFADRAGNKRMQNWTFQVK